MATNSYYGVSRPFNIIGSNNQVTADSSSTSAAEVELRVMVVTDTGTHNMTKAEVLAALMTLYRYIMDADLMAGEGGASANIPLPIGAPTAGV